MTISVPLPVLETSEGQPILSFEMVELSPEELKTYQKAINVIDCVEVDRD